MVSVWFLLLMLSPFTNAKTTYYCADSTYTLVGKNCYHIEDDPNKIRKDFATQESDCQAINGFLSWFDTKDDQTALVNHLTSTKGAEFDFFIGVQCDRTVVYPLWTWINKQVSYNPDVSNFNDLQFDRESCKAVTDNPSFLLDSGGKWWALSSYPPTFTPTLAICQMQALDVNQANDDTTTVIAPGPPPDNTTLILVLVGVIVILVAVLVFLVLKFRKKITMLMNQLMENRREARNKGNDDDPESAEYDKSRDSWEVGRQFVEILYKDKLGTGAFGVVFLGRLDAQNLPESKERSLLQISALKQNNGCVAVKMLHESADKMAEIEFRQEIELMKSIGYHDRLVNIIACVSNSLPNLLITEYCSDGDLLSYLKKRREYMIELPRHVDYRDLDKGKLISQEQQLQFTVQIAYGLEYLSSRGFVHRDIAARNILVDPRSGCKIGDFGLCRKVQEEQELYLSRGGRLPIKWMSPEALRRYEMSTASDVWSYGILLFEIITLGGSPYPNWEPAEILPRLEAGERMERPDNCPDAVFEAMSLCWRKDPDQRPTFAQLRSKLATALEKSPSEYYLQLDAQKDYYLVPKSKDQPIPEEEFIRMP